MSAPGPDCVICGRPALHLNGWDGGFASYYEFRAVWDPPRVFQDSVHFSCLRAWEHRDEMLAELASLATDSVLEWDVEFNGETHHLTRNGLGYTRRLLQTGDILILQHDFSADWLIVDFAGSWQFIGRENLLRLVRGEACDIDDGRGRYGLRLSPAPPEPVVSSWTIGDCLRHLGITDRYPGLTQNGATLKVDTYRPDNGHLEYTVRHPLSIHPLALSYFRDRFTRDGEAAFESVAMTSELPVRVIQKT